jgi:hypothetical protein
MTAFEVKLEDYNSWLSLVRAILYQVRGLVWEENSLNGVPLIFYHLQKISASKMAELIGDSIFG